MVILRRQHWSKCLFLKVYDSSGSAVSSVIQVSTIADRDQYSGSLASLSSGGFVVTWDNGRPGISANDIYGQIFDNSGNKTGSEFQINSDTLETHWDADVIGLPNGDFIAVWEKPVHYDTYFNSASNLNIIGQKFSSSGSKIGSEFYVNTFSQDTVLKDGKTYHKYNYDPEVAPYNNGGFIVKWKNTMTASSNNGDELYGHREIRQIFDSSGNKVGGNILPTKITGVPTNSEVGTHNVTLRVADKLEHRSKFHDNS